VGRSLGWLVDVVDGGDAIEAARRLGPADALVVTTHDPVLGPDVLGAALGSRAFFVGALGSRGTQARRAERLTEMGFGSDDLARVHGPVGLDLGARSPAETALSICAEVLAVRSGRAIASLRDRPGPINA
jgi:xanthine dehydrogenase accessory factor